MSPFDSQCFGLTKCPLWGGRPRPRLDPLVEPSEAFAKSEVQEPDEGVRRGPGDRPTGGK